ncbi:MAG: HAD family hydrolase [Solirubrobacterales bacterium]
MAPRDITTVAFDGDDTLWHNEPLFWATKERFTELLAPWAEPEHLAERSAEIGRANLRLFGYGIKGFALSLIETAIMVSNGAVPSAVIHEIVERAKDMLAHPVHLLDGAREAVEFCRGRYRTVLITKGDLLDQESKIARSGLAELFDAVEIVSEKDEGCYRRLLALHGSGPEHAVMVGNSVRSDVLPVIAAGGWTVQVAYPLVWEHERAEAPIGHPRYTHIESLLELPGWLQP